MARIDILHKMLTEYPTDGFILFALAKEYENNAQSDKALEFYAQLREIDPNYGGLYYHFGNLMSQLGRHEEAVEILDAGIDVAQAQNDRHSLSELMELRMGYE